MYNIAVIEDNLEIRKSISDHFANSTQVACVMAVDTVEKFVKFHRDFLEIDLILLDIRLYNQSGIHGLPLIRQREPNAEIVMYTIVDDYDAIFQAICGGATGYLLKDHTPQELEEKIVSVMNGNGALLSPQIARRIIGYFNNGDYNNIMPTVETDNLSQKEHTIITLLKDGFSYAQIATHLGISVNGVRYYIKNIYRKLEVKSRGELARKTRHV